ncbi:hypothetical protein K470DRAFT_258375 [Piedraia hortae CBS 480.64]|uniref:Mitochondrial distribution and morphology protein 10 n=1 Tax=Piedraia hortae CBS 480.64 TaxID=1314780 RepID=A0A6A7BYH9_9PEZI|nr:hypothetical protein K470DRAFT_258375 [Piedraia hortae CBS 480.64]
MLEFMDTVLAAFHVQTRWDVDQSYATLTATAHNVLDFHIPNGVKIHASSLSSPNFATSYTLGSRGVVDGSLSFLYSSLGLHLDSQSARVPLESVVKGYRQLRRRQPLEEGNSPRSDHKKDSLLYGRVYLPGNSLEALYLRRISARRLLRLNCVSDGQIPNSSTLLAVLQNDNGRYSTEYLYSTDSSLLGVRGLYNFGYNERSGRLSAGAEAYFSPVNKSGGMSCGLRFTTLPAHGAFPYTMTLTVNPLMGNLSSAYAVKAGPDLAFCSRFDFNVYSYESQVTVGMELWKRGWASPETAWMRQMIRPGWKRNEEDITGVFKARMDTHGKFGLLWETKYKDLLVSMGTGLDLKSEERMVMGNVGLEVSYSN